MKTIIAGGRDIDDFALVKEAVAESGFEITEVVSGKAPGVDSLGEQWARENDIPVKEFPADWDTHGKQAGPMRNRQMAQYADALVAIWDGQSRGTSNMIQNARAYGLEVHVRMVK